MKNFIELVREAKKLGRSDILELCQKSRSFVFDLKGKYIPASDAKSKTPIRLSFTKEDKGFSHEVDPQSVELVDNPYSVYSIEKRFDEEKQQWWMISVGDAMVPIGVILVEEISPKINRYWTVAKLGEKKDIFEFPRALGDSICNQFLEKLRTGVLGLEKPSIASRKRYGSNFTKDIIHVYPISLKNKPTKGLCGEIDYKHRFLVRGHWRKISGIGKNREGSYCIDGYTWVINHVRGPEEMPLIKKNYVVHLKETAL